MEDLLADSLILAHKIIISEHSLQKMSDTGGNFISDKFKTFWRNLWIEQAVSSLYHQQSNWQEEACIKFMMQTIKRYVDTKYDTHIALLQIRSAPLEPGLPRSATLLFNHPIRGIMPILSRLPICPNNNDGHYEVLVKRQPKNFKNHDGGPWTHGTVVGKGDHSHNNRSYTIYITNTGWLITRNSKHVNET